MIFKAIMNLEVPKLRKGWLNEKILIDKGWNTSNYWILFFKILITWKHFIISNENDTLMCDIAYIFMCVYVNYISIIQIKYIGQNH